MIVFSIATVLTNTMTLDDMNAPVEKRGLFSAINCMCSPVTEKTENHGDTNPSDRR